MPKYINCFRCNDNGNGPEPCRCAEDSESPSTPGCAAPFDKYNKRLCGAIGIVASLEITKLPITDEQARELNLILNDIRMEFYEAA